MRTNSNCSAREKSNRFRTILDVRSTAQSRTRDWEIGNSSIAQFPNSLISYSLPRSRSRNSQGQIAVPTTGGAQNSIEGSMNMNAYGTAVIGGGNTAMDACRTALRVGAGKVVLLYRRTRAEMPALDIEIEEALHEGVQIDYLAAPVRVVVEEGRMTALEIAFDDVAVKDGWLDIILEPKKGQPCISGIIISGRKFVRRINCGGPAVERFEGNPPRTRTMGWGPQGTAHGHADTGSSGGSRGE